MREVFDQVVHGKKLTKVKKQSEEARIAQEALIQRQQQEAHQKQQEEARHKQQQEAQLRLQGEARQAHEEDPGQEQGQELRQEQWEDSLRERRVIEEQQRRPNLGVLNRLLAVLGRCRRHSAT